MSQKKLGISLYIIFTLSGFSGLIYESIWSHYLKLFLGHAAYSQILVLGIFMGGMGFGAWLTSKLVSRLQNLLLVYALVEGLIGLCGLGFHSVFVSLLSFSYNTVFPSLESTLTVQLYKWSAGALIILPQSILLGSTFPLMSNGLIRIYSDRSGYSLSMLYFTNSIGASIGVLVSGFYLIAKTGLPGTILTAGIINIFLAIAVYILSKSQSFTLPSISQKALEYARPNLILVAAFVTGAASFIYEIAWLRMLSMVLGASTHAFELMLSAFIFGLATGSLWIRNRIDNIQNPLRVVGIIQICMGVSALLTLPLYNYTFNLMAFFMEALGRTSSGYVLFNTASHFIALIIMLPTTICAGMTFPLFTHILLKQGYGERSVGQIYASNTFGAIFGVAFIVLVGMPLVNLKGSMIIGSCLDMLLGLVLIRYAIKNFYYSPKKLSAMMAFPIAIIVIISHVNLDTKKMSSGVFRHGGASLPDYEILYYKDGKTASISITKTDADMVTIRTNGKPDAVIGMGDKSVVSMDEYTMTLLGALPVSYHPQAKTVATIGMGSGLTSHTLLAWPGIAKVDTIEIESAVIEAARYFRPRVDNIFDDPRSMIYIEDAKSFFSTHNAKYDIIISEPSNPWVSGVSSLFTEEFYSVIKNYMNPDGLFVQWIHTYEIDIGLLLSVIKALSLQFGDYKIYAANDYDLIILASPEKIFKTLMI